MDGAILLSLIELLQKWQQLKSLSPVETRPVPWGDLIGYFLKLIGLYFLFSSVLSRLSFGSKFVMEGVKNLMIGTKVW